MNANVMKTNNGKRLIAAVAVLAMVLCAFAIAMPASDAADPESEVTVIAPTGTMDVDFDGETAVFTGIAVGITEAMDSNKTWCEGGTFATCFTNAYDSKTPWGYSFVEIDGLNSLIPSEASNIVIEQKNSALKSGAAYGDEVDDSINQTTGVKTKTYTSETSAKYALLVPDDNSNVVITVYEYDEKATANSNKGKVIDTITLNFSEVVYADESVTIGDKITFDTPVDGLYVAVNGTTVTYYGEAVGVTSTTDSNKTWCEGGTFATCFTNAYDNQTPWGYSFVEIDGLNSLIPSGDTKVIIQQTNSALKSGAAYGEQVDATINQANGVKTKEYDSTGSAKYALLVPKDSSNVTIAVYAYDETSEDHIGSQLAKYTLDFSSINTVSKVTDVSELDDAFSQNNIVYLDSSKVTGTSTQPVSLEIPQDEKKSLILGDLTAPSYFTVKYKAADGAQSENIAVTFSGITGEDVSISYGSVEIAGKNLTGTAILNSNDVVITNLVETEGQDGTSTNGLTIESNSTTDVRTLTLDGNVTIRSEDDKDGLTIEANVDVVASSGVTTTLAGNITVKAGASLSLQNIDGTGTITVERGGSLSYVSKTDGVKIVNNGQTSVDDGRGLKDLINEDTVVSEYSYLTGKTTIAEGVTLTITRTGTLDLMGFELIVNGSIVVERGGSVDSSATASANAGIQLTATGSIENNGIIGNTNPVIIRNSAATEQYVEQFKVTGMSIELERVSGTADEYNMNVYGDVSRISGSTNSEITLNEVASR